LNREGRIEAQSGTDGKKASNKGNLRERGKYLQKKGKTWNAKRKNSRDINPGLAAKKREKLDEPEGR